MSIERWNDWLWAQKKWAELTKRCDDSLWTPEAIYLNYIRQAPIAALEWTVKP